MRSLKILSFARRALVLGALAVFSGVYAQNPVNYLLGEYRPVGSLVGDQVYSAMNGRWLVWQDNATDDDGLGISARRLSIGYAGENGGFRVNQNGAGDQENPKVATLNDGGAVVVWQGGALGRQRIYARFVSPSGAFTTTNDIQVNTYTNQQQSFPAVAALSNGNVIVVWQSYDQDGSVYGVYGRVLTTTGAFVSQQEFRINQTTLHSQRNPAVAALANGTFAVTWISESVTFSSQPNTFPGDSREYSVASPNAARAQLYARLFNADGTPLGGNANEYLVTTAPATTSPVATGLSDGGFFVAWSQRDAGNVTNNWDVFARSYTAVGTPRVSAFAVNQTRTGDQHGPKVAAQGTNVFIAWTSMGHDGSYEGVFGQCVRADGALVGSEMQANTTAVGRQIHPSVGADGNGVFLICWSSFVGGVASMDLFGQRVALGTSTILLPPDPPFVFAGMSSSALTVTWPGMVGYDVAEYKVYVDGSATPLIVSNGLHVTVSGLVPASTHTFRLSYKLSNGQESPLSAEASGRTWGLDSTNDGLPDDWQSKYWGATAWPAADVDSDGDGASNLMEFLAATDPTVAASVLRARLRNVSGTMIFSWNTQPGLVYQMQRATNLGVWENYGVPQFAFGIRDDVVVPPVSQSTFYRVICLR